METFRQKDRKDCGVACVVMLTGASYDDVHAFLYPAGKSKLTHTKDLHAALVRFGRKPLTDKRISFRKKCTADLDTDALIFVKMGKKGDGCGHWIVWDASARELRDPDRPEKKNVKRGFLAVE